MADDSQPIKYVYVDSTNRDVSIYPDGSSYTLHLTAPLHSVVQVDLVAAKVPNTMYNLTSGSNVLAFNSSNVSIPPGFYTPCGLARALMNAAGGTIFCLEFIQDEGKFLISSGAPFMIEGRTAEILNLLGLNPGTHSSFAAASDQVYARDPRYQGKYLYKSPKIIDITTNEYIFLDIDELRTTSVIDAKKLVGATGTTEGATMRSTFGQVPMDVPSGSIKNFKETSDYKQFVQFTTPIPKLQRLTVRWVDHQGQLINFQSYNNNAFTLRFHCEYQKVPDPTPPLQDVEIKRIVEALTFQVPEKKPEEPRRKIPWWILFLVFVSVVVAWKTFSKTSAQPAPPVGGQIQTKIPAAS